MKYQNEWEQSWQHLNKPRHDYRKARGVIPWKHGDEPPEDVIRRLRGDPDYTDNIRDPLRAARGIFTMIVFAIVFWGSIIALVWMANQLIGGGG